MTKIRTALNGSFGAEISTGKGPVKFDGNGVAEVSEETAEYLTTNFPDVYYMDGEARPTPNSKIHKDPANDPAVKEFARGHNATKDLEQRSGVAQVVESSKVEESKGKPSLVDASGNELKAADVNKDGVVDEKDLSEVHKEYAKEEKERDAVEETAEGVSDETSDETAELDAETVSMLEKLSVKDIHATLVSAGVQDDETAKIKDKKSLIPIAAQKLT